MLDDDNNNDEWCGCITNNNVLDDKNLSDKDLSNIKVETYFRKWKNDKNRLEYKVKTIDSDSNPSDSGSSDTDDEDEDSFWEDDIAAKAVGDIIIYLLYYY